MAKITSKTQILISITMGKYLSQIILPLFQNRYAYYY